MYKTIQRLRSDESGVSPVIGVILMVAITVILAAVIAAFVLGFGADQESPPHLTIQTSETMDGSEVENVTFTHAGGDGVDIERLSIEGPGGLEVDVSDLDAENRPDERYSSGRTIVISGSDEEISLSSEISEGGEIHLVWTSEDGESSTVLRTHTLTAETTGWEE